MVCLTLVSLIGCDHNQSSNQIKENLTMKKRIINPWTWQDNYGFVQANEVRNVNRTLYTAGIVSVDENGNLLFPNDMEKQLNQIIDNMEVLLNQAGFELSDVVRFTYYTTDVQGFTSASPVLSSRLGKANCKPATSLIGVNALFHPECVVEIDAIVVN
jgi:enamine deaminase RidA (YjgF/YER057c/UK114 family)